MKYWFAGEIVPGRTGDEVTILLLGTVSKGLLSVNDEVCREFERLIAEDLNEDAYQDFLEEHPAIVDPLASEVIPLQRLGEHWKTDFVVRRLDDQYIFVEIEKPRDPPIRYNREQEKKHPQPSPQLSHALGQVLNWFIWLEDHIAYAREYGFPKVHSPRGLIIIGRDQELADDQRRFLRALNDQLHPRIQILTYDDLLRLAHSVFRNLTAR